jgi:hypothetical protein
LKQVKDSRQHFDKISADLDTALARHAQAPKNSNKNQIVAASGSSANTVLAASTLTLTHQQGMQRYLSLSFTDKID